MHQLPYIRRMVLQTVLSWSSGAGQTCTTKNLDASKELGISLGPGNAKKKNGEKQWGQVDVIIDKKMLEEESILQGMPPLVIIGVLKILLLISIHPQHMTN